MTSEFFLGGFWIRCLSVGQSCCTDGSFTAMQHLALEIAFGFVCRFFSLCLCLLSSICMNLPQPQWKKKETKKAEVAARAGEQHAAALW